jgi:hypothetical protein
MHRQQYGVIVVAQTKQTHAGERRMGQVEGPPRSIERSALGLTFAETGRQLG